MRLLEDDKQKSIDTVIDNIKKFLKKYGDDRKSVSDLIKAMSDINSPLYAQMIENNEVNKVELIEIIEEVTLPSTDIILEKGDRIEILTESIASTIIDQLDYI